MLAVTIIFWLAVALLLYAQLGYGLLLALLGRVRSAGVGGSAGVVKSADPIPASAGAEIGSGRRELPRVTVIVPAYAEESVIAGRVENLRALDYPRERLELIVACDGSPDGTPAAARAAGADLVLELPRGGKIRAQDAGVARASGEILAFSDANARWERDALRHLVGAFAEARVGYACGQVRFVNAHGTNQEGVYWRYEMALRAFESRLASVTAGNGAIYATRATSYLHVDPVMGHDLSFPFNMVKRGWRAVYVPQARASERMVPSIEGEFARKRRMMSHTWAIVLRGGLLSPRGYRPLYALMIFSHRVLRYLSPFLHAAALLGSLVLIAHGWVYAVALALQLVLLAAALLAGRLPGRPLLIARYYVLTTLSPAAGLWDWLRHGVDAGWEPAEGTR